VFVKGHTRVIRGKLFYADIIGLSV